MRYNGAEGDAGEDSPMRTYKMPSDVCPECGSDHVSASTVRYARAYRTADDDLIDKLVCLDCRCQWESNGDEGQWLTRHSTDDWDDADWQEFEEEEIGDGEP